MFSRLAYQLNPQLNHKNILLEMPTNSKLQFNDVTSIGTSTHETKQGAFLTCNSPNNEDISHYKNIHYNLHLYGGLNKK